MHQTPLGMIVIKKLFVVLPKNRQRIDFSWALSLPVLSTCSCSDGPFTPQVCFAGLKWSMVLLHKKRQNLYSKCKFKARVGKIKAYELRGLIILNLVCCCRTLSERINAL